ncbi:tetratricopeptide repeat protein [Peredibacter sp. HCB2-198]|uniref:tetratricopeptide repeat protein n=1 Tax=Peredibacter sp. HCB2-198 TaxID=3383025 RepID=UPI0038B57E57
MTKILSIVVLATLFTSCIKTADQVNREKRFDNMSEQLKDSQGLMADMVGQLKDMQKQLDQMNGKIEELEHKQGQANPETAKLTESVNLMKTQQETEAAQLLQIQNELKEQRTFIEKVTASIAAMSEKEKAPSKTSKKKSARSELDQGLQLIKENKYAEARTELEALIDHNDLTPGDHNKVMHGLGKVEYYTGNHEKALVYFSKIYTKYPKASLAPSSLLFIGRSLNKMGKKDEAKQAFAKVVEDYKGTKEANEAKKEL